MKTFFLSAFVLVQFLSCKTAIEIEDPDNFSHVSGSVHFNTGEVLSGKLTLSRTMGAYVKVDIDGEPGPQYHRLSEIAGCTIRGRYYDLKKINDGIAFRENARYHFMTRLTLRESRIGLYQLVPSRPLFTGRYRFPVATSYFIHLENEKGNGVWDINHSKLTPNFAQKMSEIVKDCPGLAQKIARKQPGYFYPLLGVTDEDRIEVIMRIINEYNHCTNAPVTH